jgi:hypothetical protein
VNASGCALAQAALGLVGTPFRLHGRDPATGLDCVGLVGAALTAAGGQPVAPAGYGLRNLGIDHWLPLAKRSGLTPVAGPVGEGDVLLIVLGFAQHHLAIAIDPVSVVHAHAGLRRVVHQPRDPAWRIGATWRLAPIAEG